MKHLSASILLILFLSNLHAGEIEEVFTFQKPVIGHVDSYQLLYFNQLLQTGKTGEPTLPYQAVRLLLPPGEAAISIDFEGSDEVAVPGYYQLYPRQESRPLSDPGNRVFLKDESVYSTDAPYPSGPCGQLTTEYLNGHAIALSTFTPVTFNPVTGVLTYFGSVKITVHTAPDPQSAKALENLSSSSLVKKRLNRFVQNPESLEWYPASQKSVDDYQLLIVTPESYADDFEEYVDLYIPRGIQSEIATTEAIDLVMTGQDMPEKIRNYIIGEYQDHGIEYVLLGGDVEHVPYRGFYCYVESGGGYTDNGIPADLYYSALDGTWNDDNDNLWGEIGEDDLLPELAVARFSFSTLTELDNMVHKTEYYQNQPVLGEFNDAVLAGEWLYGNPETWGSDYLELLIGYQNENGYETWGIPEEYTFHKLYEEQTSWGANDLIAEINAGRQFIHHVGHANSTYVAYMSNSTITNANFSGANGIDHNYTLFQSHGCICGAFDDNDCIMEKMVSIENFAVAVIGNSRYGWFNEGQTEGPAAHLHREMMDAMYHEKMNHLGQAFTECKIQTAPWVTAPGQWEEGALRWNFYDINILGDPALSIWTAEPISIGVDHSGAYVLGTGTYDVAVTSGGEPQDNFSCVLLYEGEIHGVGITDDNGQAAIQVYDLLDPGEAELVVSGYNCLPAGYVVDLVPPGSSYVHYLDHSLNDAAGNGNGEIDCGETGLLLDLSLENIGSEVAENVEAVLTTANPYVTVTDGTATFGSIDPAGTPTVPSAFSFDAADNIPDQEEVEFEITISWDGEEDMVVNYFTETANAPALAIGAIAIDDSQSGNANGILDPGEEVTVSIVVGNEGHCASQEVTGTLVSSDPGVAINNPSFDLGILGEGETTTAEFTVSVDENMAMGSTVTLAMDASAGAYFAQQVFALSIGLIIEDFETGDFSSFNWEFTGNADWTVTGQSPYEGDYSARSGSIGDQQTSSLQISMDILSDGEITFYRKVSSEADYDFLRFYIDNALLGEWDGEVPWGEETYPVTAGNHTFKWMYEKDFSVSGGSDCGWVDYIVFPPANGLFSVLSVTATASPEEICQGQSAQLNALALGGSGNYTYAWDPPTGLSDPTIANPTASPAESVLYTVAVDDGNDLVEAQVNLVVHENPETPAIVQEDDHLVSSASEGNQWYGPGGPVPGANGQVFYPTATGDYYVQVENEYGCVSDPSNTLYFIVTTIESNGLQGFSIYPNPSSGTFMIVMPGPSISAEITICSTLGEQIMKCKRNLGNDIPVSVTMKNPEKGIYILRVHTRDSNHDQIITVY